MVYVVDSIYIEYHSDIHNVDNHNSVFVAAALINYAVAFFNINLEVSSRSKFIDCIKQFAIPLSC